MSLISRYSLAEVEEQSFEYKHRACAAENSQGLTSQQTEHCSGQCCTQETFQHSLQHSTHRKTHTDFTNRSWSMLGLENIAHSYIEHVQQTHSFITIKLIF